MGKIYPMHEYGLHTAYDNLYFNVRAAWLGLIFIDQIFMAIMVPAYPHEMNTG